MSEKSWSEDRTHDHIYAAIVEQRLRPGMRLKEDELCDIYGLSRTRIRNVLARLSRERVVTIEKNRGASVARPSVSEAREIFAARRLIETHLIELAAAHWSDSARSRLEAQLALERAAHERGDGAAALVAGGQFHIVIAELSRTSFLKDFLEQMIAQTSLISAAYETGTRHECEFDEHMELVSRLARGDKGGAKELMDRHIRGIEARLDLSGREAKGASVKQILLAS